MKCPQDQLYRITAKRLVSVDKGFMIHFDVVGEGKWMINRSEQYRLTMWIAKKKIVCVSYRDNDQTLRFISTKFCKHVFRLKFLVEFVSGKIAQTVLK